MMTLLLRQKTKRMNLRQLRIKLMPMIKKPNRQLQRPKKSNKKLSIWKSTTNSTAPSIILTGAEYSPTVKKSEESTLTALSWWNHLSCVVLSRVMMTACRRNKQRTMKRLPLILVLLPKNKMKRQHKQLLLRKLSRKLNIKENTTHLMAKCMKIMAFPTT
jgi:hypothetical protein